ncbi:hypothetical protein BCR44DRAFT_1430678 [Catenaria anguillulae PL171]|uniref:Uncharacterized protein n=1 Tax=Catenaria anguillulae PL171 TaxID=765915 RepID=A0A1Y2HTD7_9FUNG|nr:hypothetical protein BCR44DRAFT_1430678 [Catenaria anguillulae PL171]
MDTSRSQSNPHRRPGRHILVLALCNLVSPHIISFDFLFDHLVALLASIAHHQYVLVLFPPPPTATEALAYQPRTYWLLWKMRGLEYRFKKNIQAVYIVGYAGWEFHATAAVLLTITSPKFKRKLVYIPTLASLPVSDTQTNSITINEPDQPSHVLTAALPLATIRIPPATLAYNHTLDPSWLTSTLTPTTAAALLASAAPTWRLPIESEFGTHPYLLATPIPRVIAILARILANGRNTQGLFRRTVLKIDASLACLPQTKHCLLPRPCSHAGCATCPRPFSTTPSSQGVLASAHSPDAWPPLVFPPTDPPHLKRTMAVIARVLVLVAEASESSMMPAHNLSRVWAPNVVRTADPLRDMQLAADTSSVVHVMIQQWCTRDGWERWFGEFKSIVDQIVGC